MIFIKDKKRKKHRLSGYIVAVMCILIALYFIAGREISVRQLLALSPENSMAAAALFLLLYAIKSASVVFPLAILEITVGHL